MITPIIGTRFTTPYKQSQHTMQSNQPSFGIRVESLTEHILKSGFELPTQLAATRAENAILTALSVPLISKAKIKGKDILDWGCGTGYSTRAIKEMLNPGKIMGLDIKDYWSVSDRSMFKLVDDSVEYLAKGEKKFALIIASMLEPFYDAGRLLKAAPNSMSEHGQFLAYSDSTTIEILRRFLKILAIKYDFSNVYGSKEPLQIVVISKAELEKLSVYK